HVAAAGPRERRDDLVRGSVAIGREPVVRPHDPLGGPCRQLAHIEIHPERSGWIVLDPVADRRCPNNGAVRKHDIHPLSLGEGAAAGCAPGGVTRLSRLCPESQMSFTTTAKWRVPNEPSLVRMLRPMPPPLDDHVVSDSLLPRLVAVVGVERFAEARARQVAAPMGSTDREWFDVVWEIFDAICVPAVGVETRVGAV